MSLKGTLVGFFGRREVNAVRDGKRGKEAQAVVKALDGWKRIIVVVFFALGAVANLVTGQDYTNVIEAVVKMLGWSLSDAAVSSVQVAALVTAVWAVIDGLKKAKKPA